MDFALKFVSVVLTTSLMIVTGCGRSGPVEEPNEMVLRHVLYTKIKGLDPGNMRDAYSVIVGSQIFETLYQYHFLKRPYEFLGGSFKSSQHPLILQIFQAKFHGIQSGFSRHNFNLRFSGEGIGIVSRCTPRSRTKGMCTVGRGLIKANMVNMAKNIMPKTKKQVFRFDLDGIQDDEKGICGGSIEFLIETFDKKSIPLFKELSIVIENGALGVADGLVSISACWILCW